MVSFIQGLQEKSCFPNPLQPEYVVAKDFQSSRRNATVQSLASKCWRFGLWRGGKILNILKRFFLNIR